MTGQPLTILQLTHQGGPAGSTQSIFNLSQYLARRGHRVLVGCRGDVLLARLARAAGLPVVPLAFMPRAALMSALTAVLGRERVDVVNSHATLDRRALTWLRWRGKLPPAFVVTRRTMPLTSALEILAVGLTADRTIAVSGAVARALRRRWQPGARLRVVPNGIASMRSTAMPLGTTRSRAPGCQRRRSARATAPLTAIVRSAVSPTARISSAEVSGIVRRVTTNAGGSLPRQRSHVSARRSSVAWEFTTSTRSRA